MAPWLKCYKNNDNQTWNNKKVVPAPKLCFTTLAGIVQKPRCEGKMKVDFVAANREVKHLNYQDFDLDEAIHTFHDPKD